MEYRTNRVNSAGTGGIEPKNFERDGPKFSSARTEISENPQIFTQQISGKTKLTKQTTIGDLEVTSLNPKVEGRIRMLNPSVSFSRFLF